MNKITKGLAIVGAILIVLLAIVGFVSLKGDTGFVGNSPQNSTNYQVMSGVVPTSTPASLCLMPISKVEANSTTTNSANDGCLINQLLHTDGIEQLDFAMTGKGFTATSSLFTFLQGSYDNINWYDITNATTTDDVGTSTPLLAKRVVGLDFGLTTTTRTFSVLIPAYNYIRTIFYGEDIATDPNDQVKANIIVSWINK